MAGDHIESPDASGSFAACVRVGVLVGVVINMTTAFYREVKHIVNQLAGCTAWTQQTDSPDLFVQLHTSSGVTHCCSANITRPAAKQAVPNLVLVRTNLLEIWVARSVSKPGKRIARCKKWQAMAISILLNMLWCCVLKMWHGCIQYHAYIMAQ